MLWPHVAALAVYGLLAIALLAPMASNVRLPDGPDHTNHIGTIVQARMAIEEGQFPLRVAPWQHQGWRYPLFQFYSSVPYLAAGLVHKWVSPENPFVAYKIVLWGAFLLGGFSMYLCGNWLTRVRRAGLLAGAVYMTTPYFLLNVHVRGAFTEAVAQGLLPLVVYCALRCYVAEGLSPWLFAAGISWALLAMTHTITYLWGAFFAGLLFVAMAIHRRGIAAGLWRVGGAFALGIGLSTHVLALVSTADYLFVRRKIGSMFKYAWITPLETLLSPTALPPTPQPGGTPPGFAPSIGWPILLGVGVMVYARWSRDAHPLSNPEARRVSGVLIGLFTLAVILTWSPVDFWSWLPQAANIAQFPYRMLAQVAWTGALLTAGAFVVLLRGGPDPAQTAVAFLLIVVAHSSFLPTLRSADHGIETIVRAPDTGYGQYDYLADAGSLTFQPGSVDTFPLAAIDEERWLLLARDLEIPRQRVGALAMPTLHIHGSVPPGITPDLIQVTVTIDGHYAGTIPVIQGPVEAILPMSTPLFAGSSPTVRIRLTADHGIERPNGSPRAIQATGVEISGLKDAVPVESTRMLCTRLSDQTRCQFHIADHATNVQLPVLFYPQLLSVMVDGNPAPYMPLPAGAYPFNYAAGRGVNPYLLAGVRLEPGVHEVTARFQGLWWANLTSAIAWIGTLAGLALVAGRGYARRQR